MEKSKKNNYYEKVQAKIFTKWINLHLEKVSMKIDNLFVDITDYRFLSKLLEILSGEKILQSNDEYNDKKNKENIHKILSFLRTKKKALDIYATDIINGNRQSILKIIWEIIYHFEIQSLIFRHEIDDSNGNAPEQYLLTWCQRITTNYICVQIYNFKTSWSSGLALNAIIHANRPDLFNFNQLLSHNDTENLKHAFEIGYSELGIPKLLEPEDLEFWIIEEKSIMLYISLLYRALVQKTDLEFAKIQCEDLNDMAFPKIKSQDTCLMTVKNDSYEKSTNEKNLVVTYKFENNALEEEKLSEKSTSFEKLNSSIKKSNSYDDIKNNEEIKKIDQNVPIKQNTDFINPKNNYSDESENKKNDSNLVEESPIKNNKNEEKNRIKYIKNDYNITINKSSDSVMQNVNNDLQNLFPLLTGTILTIFIGVLLIRVMELD